VGELGWRGFANVGRIGVHKEQHGRREPLQNEPPEISEEKSVIDPEGSMERGSLQENSKNMPDMLG